MQHSMAKAEHDQISQGEEARLMSVIVMTMINMPTSSILQCLSSLLIHDSRYVVMLVMKMRICYILLSHGVLGRRPLKTCS